MREREGGRDKERKSEREEKKKGTGNLKAY